MILAELISLCFLAKKPRRPSDHQEDPQEDRHQEEHLPKGLRKGLQRKQAFNLLQDSPKNDQEIGRREKRRNVLRFKYGCPKRRDSA